MIDTISQRRVIAQVRNVVKAIPLAWDLYGLYWKVRTRIEASRKYLLTRPILYFGPFPEPTLDSAASQLCTANQILTPTYRKWCNVMRSPARFARKQWEFVYILQALTEAGMLGPGRRGVGFGCGREPLTGIFARYGCNVLATDLDQDTAKSTGWVDTLQHSDSLEELYVAAKHVIAKRDFFQRVSFRNVDMNTIPEDLHGQYDFLWSACALEHLGSLRHGMNFIKNSIRCLKPGGVAVHTTEFNLSSDDQTFESPSLALYRARDIKTMITELESEGYWVKPLNLNTGGLPIDNYIDAPPYGFSPHLKLQLMGHVVTSIGIIIKRPSSEEAAVGLHTPGHSGHPPETT